MVQGSLVISSMIVGLTISTRTPTPSRCKDLGSLSVWINTGAQGNQGSHRLVQLDTEVLWKYRHEIEYVSTKATVMGALMARLTDSMMAVEAQWLSSLAGLGSRLGDGDGGLVRLLGDYGRSSSSPVEELLGE